MSAPMAANNKKRIQNAFKKRSENCLYSRILICADAYGLGVDNPDIQRVYIWMLLSSIAKIYQRLDRANRCDEGLAHFIFLFPKWCEEIRSEKDALRQSQTEKSITKSTDAETRQINGEQDDLTEMKKSKSRKKMPKAENRRHDMPRDIWGLINSTLEKGCGCHREAGLRFFNDVELNDTTPSTFEKNRPNPCCSTCHPDKQISTVPHEMLNSKREKNKLKRLWFRRQLEEWRKNKAADVLGTSFLQFTPSLIMPNVVLKTLDTWGHVITNEDDLKRELGDTWGALPKYSAEILEILERGQALDKNSDEILIEIRKDKTEAAAKKAGTLPAVNVALAAFEGRRARWLLNNVDRSRITAEGEGREELEAKEGSENERIAG